MKTLIIYLSSDKKSVRVVHTHETFKKDFAQLASDLTNGNYYSFKVI